MRTLLTKKDLNLLGFYGESVRRIFTEEFKEKTLFSFFFGSHSPFFFCIGSCSAWKFLSLHHSQELALFLGDLMPIPPSDAIPPPSPSFSIGVENLYVAPFGTKENYTFSYFLTHDCSPDEKLPYANGFEPRNSCTVTTFSEIKLAVSSCSEIVIDGITVPAGESILLDLNEGTTVTFKGTIKFEYKEWYGPLLKILGHGVTVQGAQGSVLNGQGDLYWDGLGSLGRVKPRFMRIKATGYSNITNIHLLNCPHSEGLTLSGWNIDCSAGGLGGHNTDGFDISSSTNLVLKDSVILNQDDCVAISQGLNLTFSGLYCSGSHGLSLSVGMSNSTPAANTLSNVVFSNCTVANSRNGIHVKTHTTGTTGYIKNVTYENINLSGITNYGIMIQEDYKNGGSTGIPKGNIPITDLRVTNIVGNLSGSEGVSVFILCGEDGCADWSWSGNFYNWKFIFKLL
ncbi:hypothetical protein NQ317_003772 [Molorchus minor]|uniref:endo-polygalacturonase n=1 Tax=Molorchus minor TaxID=1323400 RepID=A0ABQ9J0I8_9CUCU|nr:hypothetical protein NQ317_003772 [Molorchus minor]